jgi:magnesium transporter
MDTGDFAAAAALAPDLPADELDDALRPLGTDGTAAFCTALGAAQLATLLEALDPAGAADILSRLPEAVAADVLERLPPDDAADIVGAMDSVAPGAAAAILVEMESEEADDVRSLLAYPPHTAGGRMTPEFFAVTPQVTADEAIQALRAVIEGTEFRSYVYVTDHVDRLLGVVPLYRLVLSAPDTQAGALMIPNPVRMRADDDQEDVARIFRQRRFLAVPVVDSEDRLLGVVTVDDIADVLEAEATEDVHRLGGSQPLAQPYLRAGPLTLARKRIVWLLLLLLGASYTSTVLRAFGDELQSTVALALFIPLLIGTGGNVGSQTVMTVIRPLSVGEISLRHLARVWLKEAAPLPPGQASPSPVRPAQFRRRPPRPRSSKAIVGTFHSPARPPNLAAPTAYADDRRSTIHQWAPRSRATAAQSMSVDPGAPSGENARVRSCARPWWGAHQPAKAARTSPANVTGRRRDVYEAFMSGHARRNGGRRHLLHVGVRGRVSVPDSGVGARAGSRGPRRPPWPCPSRWWPSPWPNASSSRA